MKAKSKAPLCRCLAVNIERKLATQEVDINHLIQAIGHRTPAAEENQTAYDNAADLLAGFEPNCSKNPKFLGD